ncbi:MAG: hypothetical protein ACE5IW_07095, partial [bacterium]
ASGTIVATHATAGSDATGTISVSHGVLDKFAFTNIGNPIAGTPFITTIFAQDRDGNTVTTFSGSVLLTDLTGTMTPTSATLQNGSSGGVTITITKSRFANTITASGNGKVGVSNTFDVNPAPLDHFTFDPVSSPQTAGIPFGITIIAQDEFSNTVTSFTDSVNLSDNTGTISPTSFGPFTSGQITANVTIEKKATDNKITATGGTNGSKSGESNLFNVKPAALDHLRILNAAGGLGTEVGDIALTLDDQIILHAAGLDAFDNYIRDVVVNWGRTGDLDLPNPLAGTSTILDPVTPGTSGQITADTTGVTGDSTGTITVGNIAKVLIRNAAGGTGNEVGSLTITADDALTLFAAGYDAGNNFIGDVVVDWTSSGTLAPLINVSGVNSVTFLPTTAPTNGKIFADHATAADDSTGTIIVNPGSSFGNIVLTPSPNALPADGASISQITSSQIVDSDGNFVGAGRLFTVVLSDTNLGRIETPDADQGITGHQIATNSSSRLAFQFRAGTVSGSEEIFVSSANGGNATGNTVIAVGSTGQFLIANTQPNTINKSQDVGIVNTNQQFGIEVQIRNGLSEAVLDVKVRLTSNGSSVIQANEIIISRISDNSSQSVTFDITASSTQNPAGEEFTAQIIEATKELSGGNAPIGAPIDNNAFVQIQTPAELRVQFTRLDQFQTASDTFQVQATVTNLGQAEVDNSGRLRLTIPSNYTLLPTNPAEQSFSVDVPVEWEVKAPDTSTALETFIVAISQIPKDKNIDSLSAVETSADLREVQTLAVDLIVDEFSIIDPAGAMDDTLSTGQEFELRSLISYSENIDSVRAELMLALGYGFGPGFSTSVLLTNGQDQVNWRLVAPTQAHQNPRTLEVSFVSFDEGTPRDTTTATLEVVTVTNASIVFEQFRVSNPADAQTVSTGQQFQLSALVKKFGDAGIEGPAEVELNLGDSGITTQDDSIRTFVPGEAVIWNVTAPDTTTGLKFISAKIVSIPNDENTNDLVDHNPQQIERTIEIQTVEVGTVTIDTVFVSSPPGAQDDTLSTDQLFTIEAVVKWQNAVNLLAEIVLPSGYQVFGGGNRFQSIPSQGGERAVQWTLIAPNFQSPRQYIKLKAKGDDESNPQLEIVALPDSLPFAVVEKAQLNLDAAITAPRSALDRILTVGQLFTITAGLENTGQAGLIGEDSLEITLPTGYTTSEPTVKSITPGGQVTWQIRAPDAPTGILDIIVEVEDRNAIDENTNQLPPLSPAPPLVKIPVSTESVGLRVTVLTDRKPTTIVRGATDIPIFGLQFENSSDANIEIRSINLNVRDNEGNNIAPDSILSGLAVVDYFNSSVVFLSGVPIPRNNPLALGFSSPISMSPSQSQTIEFRVDIASQTDENTFRFSIDSPQRDISAINVDADTAVALLDTSGLEVSSALSSGISVLIDPTLEASFFNFPNPFGQSSRPLTKFNYNLTQDSDITIRIYTLLGELVWTKTYNATEPEGKAGNHSGDISWDGTNDKGQKVLNGVYVAVLITNSGKAITKIAIAK